MLAAISAAATEDATGPGAAPPQDPASSLSPAGPGRLPLADPSAPIEVLIISGTVTDKLAPLVRRVYDDVPGPVRVVAFGACASSGGPYWDSYCVTAGVHLVLPVDLWVPGCPPRPEALLDALRSLAPA